MYANFAVFEKWMLGQSVWTVAQCFPGLMFISAESSYHNSARLYFHYSRVCVFFVCFFFFFVCVCVLLFFCVCFFIFLTTVWWK